MNDKELNIAFDNLEINEKRNAYNEEILKLFEMLKTLSGEGFNKKIWNYNSNEDYYLSEEEYLSHEYQNILELRNIILTCIANLKKVDK